MEIFQKLSPSTDCLLKQHLTLHFLKVITNFSHHNPQGSVFDQPKEAEKMINVVKTYSLVERVLVFLSSVVFWQRNSKKRDTPSTKSVPVWLLDLTVTAVRFLNNIALLNLSFLQGVLGCGDHQVEFVHILNGVLSFCLDQINATTVEVHSMNSNSQGKLTSCSCQVNQFDRELARDDEILFYYLNNLLSSNFNQNEDGTCNGLLFNMVNEIVLLCGYYSVQQENNQTAMLWGSLRRPTTLRLLADLPLCPYFTFPLEKEVLFSSFVVICFKNEKNVQVLGKHVSLHWLIDFICEKKAKPSSVGRFSFEKRFPTSLWDEALDFFLKITKHK